MAGDADGEWWLLGDEGGELLMWKDGRTFLRGEEGNGKLNKSAELKVTEVRVSKVIGDTGITCFGSRVPNSGTVSWKREFDEIILHEAWTASPPT